MDRTWWLTGPGLVLLAGCGGSQHGGSPTEGPEARAEEVYRLLIGRYDSADQSKADADFFDIHLTICPISAPSYGSRTLYVEQARADALQEPYRQRLYVIEAGPSGTVLSHVLELSNPAAFVGYCDRPAKEPLQAGVAEEKQGCAVQLTSEAGGYDGGTVGTSCPSVRHGATYATSEVHLDGAGLVSLDRGYDAAGAQVWGSEKGPYRFVRRTPIVAE